MAEELMVFLNRSDNLGFGFSLLGTAGLPHVIYDIVENSPAALSGQVEAGDVIVKVNGTDVHRLTTKEVLKCLRLSDDPVTLQLKRDPKIKAQIRKYLAQTSNLHHSSDHHHLPNFDLDHNPTSQNHSSSSSSSTTSSSTSSPTKNRQNSGNLRAAANHHNQPRSDPICRPSRIPQAVKSPVHQSTSPNHQQSHQSHIPIFNSKSAPQSPPAAPQQQQSTSGTSNNLHHNQPHYIGLKQETSNSVESQRSTSKTNGGSGGGGVVGVSNSFNNKSNTVGSFIQSQQTQHQQQQPPTKARFEAYMMTGDLILNLSRTPQSSGLITTQHKKVDSLRNSPSHSVGRQQNGSIGPIAPHAKYDSSPSSSNSLSDDGGNGGVSDTGIIGLEQKNTSKTSKKLLKQQGIDGNYDDVQNVRMMEVDDNGGDSSSSLSNGKAVTANDVAARSDLSNKNTDQGCANTTNTRTLTTAVATNALPEDQTDNLANSRSSSSSTMRGAGDPMNSSPEMSFSVPTSPTSQSTPLIDDHSEATTGGAGDRYPLKKKESTSVPTSPDSGAQEFVRRTNGVSRTCDAAGFRTSRSEDHLQATQRDGLGAVIPIDIDEDVNSSLNTLLDTRHDSEDSPQGSDRDRIVWTYNAPVKQQSSDHSSHSSSINSSPQRTDSLASPTSVSSSVMSSNSSSKENSIDTNGPNLLCPLNGGVGGGVGGGMGGAGGGGGMDQSMSEAISNISSPDYQDDDNLLSSRDVAMAISDPSDSDSTILVSETPQHRKKMASQKTSENQYLTTNQGYAELKDSEDELATITDDQPTVLLGHDYRESSPPVSDDGSDVDSLHSFHYSPKAVDIPSAVRLAKRLYGLDGFKKSDVSRHLSKNNDFSRAVAEEYLKYFSFENSTLDEALRQFLQQFSLSGETQERERVLVHFSKRYLDCNPNCFNSQDAVHTLTCAIMLLNIDLHGQNIGRRMTCSEFIENLADLNDGDNFPKDTLKYLYQAIKANPLQWALDDEYTVPKKSEGAGDGSYSNQAIGNNPFLDAPQNPAAIEYKKGYVMRKCCYDSNNKKTPFGKRSWKMFYCTLRDLVLYLHKDEHGFRKNQMTDNVHNAIRIHHALATKANDYTKKQHVFRLQTSDQAEYLFQTSDSKELQSWIDTINFVCASFSAPPLEGGVGSQKRFQRPLLPSSHTKLLLTEQLSSHEQRMADLTAELEKHRYLTVPSKGLALQNYREKDSFLQYEIKRYKTYISVLKPKLDGDTGGDPNRHFLALQKANNDLLNSAAAIAGTTTGTVGSNSGSTARSPATSPTTPTVINNLTVAEETTTNVTSVASINQRENKNSNLQSSNSSTVDTLDMMNDRNLFSSCLCRKSTRSKKDLKQKN